MNKEELDVEDEKKKPEEYKFQTTFGLVLSCLGCVVGTGNIWRFPRVVANNSDEKGGLVFLIVWVLFLFLWSIPMLLIEYSTGRYTRKAVIGSFRYFLGDKFIWCGAWISMVTFCISCYYSVVLGWCFYYFIYYIGHSLPGDVDESRQTFREFAEESNWPVLTHFIAVLLAGFSVTKGVRTIEKVSMVLVPLLLLIILFNFIWSLTRDYADKGITFLFTPNWKTFGEPRVWVDAVSQNAFDTGAGMGLLIPYSTYMTRKNGVVRYGHLIPVGNNFVSLVCGLTVFGTVFSTLIATFPTYTQADIVDIMKDSGPASTGLTFIWMPVLFSTISGLGRALALLFFLCLSFAGVTSLMSNFELMTHTFDDFGLPRKYGMPLTLVLTFSVGLMSALNLDILTNQDFVWGFALLINGMMLQIMVIKYGTSNFRADTMNNYSLNDWKMYKLWEYMVVAVFIAPVFTVIVAHRNSAEESRSLNKFIAPLEAVALIAWWAVDLITGDIGDGENWYEFGRETLVTTLTQWIALMVVLVLVNVVWVSVRNSKKNEESTPLLQTEENVKSSYSQDSVVQSRELNSSIKDVRL